MTTEYEFHEAANIFPLDEETLGELAEDIRTSGLVKPIELMGGKVIDGRRRYLACHRAGVAPEFCEVRPADPVAYVVSLNLKRRSLTPSQRAMCAARATALQEKCAREAKERQKVRKGNQPGATPANLPDMPKGDARDQLGKTFGVSGKTVDHATRVLNNAIPEVVQAVDDGRMAVSTAAFIATEPEEVQREKVENQANRTYHSTSNTTVQTDAEPDANEEEETCKQTRTVAIRYANAAIETLGRIPKNDRLRKRGFQIVKDWLRQNR